MLTHAFNYFDYGVNCPIPTSPVCVCINYIACCQIYETPVDNNTVGNDAELVVILCLTGYVFPYNHDYQHFFAIYAHSTRLLEIIYI